MHSEQMQKKIFLQKYSHDSNTLQSGYQSYT